MILRDRFVLVCFLTIVPATHVSASTQPQALAEQIRSASIQVDRGIRVERVTLHKGPAAIELAEGTIFPASAVGGRPVEAVFIGKGSVTISPADPTEATQLELFTSRRKLEEQFTEALFVVPDSEMMTMLTKGAAAADSNSAAQAKKAYDAWKSGSERKLLNIESNLLAATLEDEGANKLFVARFRSTRLGDFDYVIDPGDRSVARLGQFVPANLTERQKRRLAGRLDREHRRGRLLGTEITDLGYFNVWTEEATSTQSADDGAFEPERYRIEVTVGDRAEILTGRASIDGKATGGGRRVVPLRLHEDLQVSRVVDGSGAPLFFLRSGRQLAVVLASAPAAGQRFSATVEFSGPMFDKEGRAFRLRDTTYWHPHLGSIDRAPYEVTLHWPAGLDLLAAGKRIDGGGQWEKRALEIPSDGYTFEVGHFAIETIEAGHVKIRLAFDPESEDRRQIARSLQNDVYRNRQIDFRARGITKQGREEIRQQLKNSLLFYEGLFGPYPLDELTVVTVPRDFSQGLPGFISLSTEMMTDPSAEFIDALTAGVDRRLVIAHEVAHQWWGDLVGWSKDRDQWLGEALACYGAEEYSRQKLDWHNRFQIGFTTRWPSMLMRYERGSRPIESLGPLVLGERLSSSREPGAYGWIVYQKGPLVVDMLAHYIGEEKFRAILHDIVAHEATKSLSTESFLNYLTRESGRDLAAFSRYFVYGTGIPEIEYDYSVQKDDGKWNIHVVGERTDPWRYRVRVVTRGEGKFDVTREKVAASSALLPTLLVPMQVALDQSGNRSGELTYATKIVNVSGQRFTFDIEIPWEPKEVFLDRDRQVLALFYTKARNQKEVLLQRGTNLMATGKLDEADAAFREAIAAKPSTEIEQALNRFAPLMLWMPVGVNLGRSFKDPLLEIQNQLTNSSLHLSLSRLYLDEGKDAAAAEELTRANQSLDRDWREWVDDELALLQSRIDVRRGQYAAAFDRLSKVLNGENESAEAYALLAIAAKQTAHNDEFQRALKGARELGVDVSALQ